MKNLEIKDLSLLKNSEVILDKISFCSNWESPLALVGKNGSGKSMLSKVITNNLPEDGDFQISGFINNQNQMNLEKSLIVQDYLNTLNPLLKIMNSIMPIPNEKRFYKILEHFSLSKSFLDMRPYHLSGGTLQQISLAWSLSSKTPFVIADEIENGLDEKNMHLIFKYLIAHTKKHKIPLIILTHNPAIAQKYCKEMIFLDKGKIIRKKRLKPLVYKTTNDPSRKKYLNESNPLIKIKNLNKSYNDKKIFSNLGLSINENSITGIMGERGSGKSTLASILSGFDNDFDAETFEIQKDIKPQLIFQNPHRSFNSFMNVKSIIEEVGIKNIRKTKRYKDLIKILELEDTKIMKKYPTELSGGQLQKIAILRALLSKTKMIICDEIDSNLDINALINLSSIINEVKKKTKCSFLVMGHNKEFIKSISSNIYKVQDNKLKLI